MMANLGDIQKMLSSVRDIQKGPPGPPPRKGLVWYEGTHRWRRPKEVTGEELSVKATTEFNDTLDAMLDEAQNTVGGRINTVRALVKDEIYKAQSAFKDHDLMNFDRKQRAVKESFAKIKRAEEWLFEWWPKDQMGKALPVVKHLRRRMAMLENIDQKMYETIIDAQLEFDVRSDIKKVAKTVEEVYGENKTVRVKLGKIESQLKKAEKLVAYGALDKALDAFDKAYDTSQEIVDYVHDEAGWDTRTWDFDEVDKATSFLREAINRVSYKLDEARMPFPTTRPGLQISTHKPIEISDDIQVDWDVKIHSGNEHMYPKESKDAKRIVNVGTKHILRNLKPNYQRQFQDWADERYPVIYTNSEWDDMMSNRAIALQPGEKVLGFAVTEGIRMPYNVSLATVVHEWGHMVDLSFELDEETSALSRQVYHERYSKGTLDYHCISEYGTTNEREFFAEYFEEYLLDPERLYRQDPEMYKIMKEGLFQ